MGLQDLDRSLGRHVRPNTEARQPIRPKDPAVPRGGECYKAYPGLGNRSTFYPGSSVGSTITLRYCVRSGGGEGRPYFTRRPHLDSWLYVCRPEITVSTIGHTIHTTEILHTSAFLVLPEYC